MSERRETIVPGVVVKIRFCSFYVGIGPSICSEVPDSNNPDTDTLVVRVFEQGECLCSTSPDECATKVLGTRGFAL